MYSSKTEFANVTQFGLRPPTKEIEAYVRGGGASRGQVLALDLGATDGAVSTIDFGTATSVFANFRPVVLNDTYGGIFGVAMEDIADDATGKIALCGVIDVKSDTNGFDAGEWLYPENSTSLLANDLDTSDLSAGTYYPLAIALEDAAGGVFGKVWFDGLNGFPGRYVTQA